MRSVTTIVIAAAVVFCTASTALAGRTPSAWRVEDVSGLASLSSKDACLMLARDGELPAGATVATRADGRVTLKRGGESIVLSPQTDLTVAASGGDETRIVQRTGLAWFKVRKLQAPHFSVETPDLTATVRGTTFTVAVDISGAAVHVREGAVEVATGWRDAVTLVPAGTMASVARATPDRIALINGGNVMRVVTGRDGAAGLRRGGGGTVGALFAGGDGLRRTAEVRLAGGRQSDATAVGVPSAQATTGSEGARAFGGRADAPARRSGSRQTPFGLPVLETMVGALILLVLIVAHTFLGSAGRAKSTRAKTDAA